MLLAPIFGINILAIFSRERGGDYAFINHLFGLSPKVVWLDTPPLTYAGGRHHGLREGSKPLVTYSSLSESIKKLQKKLNLRTLVKYLLNISIHYTLNVMKVLSYPMICNSVLREIISSNLSERIPRPIAER